MSRFYEADAAVYTILEKLINERFPNLESVKFKVLVDTKTKIDKLRGLVVFASIKPANEVEKFLSQAGHNLNGIDYIVFLSDLVWGLADATNRKRILSHELKHCFITENGEPKTIKHDIEDFYSEIELNQSDPMWGQALSAVAFAKFEELKAEDKARKKTSRP